MFNFFKSISELLKLTNTDEKYRKFIFFSEGKFYTNHFIDLVDNLKKIYGKDYIHYVTLDKFEKSKLSNHANVYVVNNSFVVRLLFKIIKCETFIMTMSDLGNHLEKSKNCKNFVYFFHAASSIFRRYTKNAFKNYDIIFVNGEYQKKELMYEEEKFLIPKKKIIVTGYFYLDRLKKISQKSLSINNCVLFAPSWNYSKKNLFDNYAIIIIEHLLKNNFKVILRPHPEHFKRSLKIIDEIKAKFSNNKNFVFDTSYSNLDSMEKAQILITDNSAIDIEYMLIFKRPVIYLDYVDKIHNESFLFNELDTIEDEFKISFGEKLNIEKLDSLADFCFSILKNKKVDIEKIKNFEKKFFASEGKSASVAANYLANNID